MAISYGPKLGLMVNGNQGEEHYLPLMKFLRAIDALIQPSVKTHTANTPPMSPADGDCHIVGTSGGGDWSGQSLSIARYSSVLPGWEFFTPKAGWIAWSDEAADHLKFNGTVWQPLSTPAVPPVVSPLVEARGSGALEPATEFNGGRLASSFDSSTFYSSALVYGNGRSTGKRYVELRLQSGIIDTTKFIAGVQEFSLIDNFNEPAHGISAYIWNGCVFRMDSKFYALDGTLVYDGASAAGTLLSSDLLCLAIDLDTGKAWYRINDNAWRGGGDPELGTGGVTISAGGVALHPVMAMFEPDMQVAINTTVDWFAYTVPAGFVGWDG